MNQIDTSHAYALGYASGSIKRAVRMLDSGFSVEAVMTELREAIAELGRMEAARYAEFDTRMAQNEAELARLKAVAP
jgi:hypothetical protein